MKQLAAGLWKLNGLPPNVINVYLAEDVLIDAGTRRAGRRILRQLRGRSVNAHALTHAHPDHQGSTHEVATALDLPVWVSEADADAVEDSSLIRRRQPPHRLNKYIERFWTGPSHPVARRLREGDEVAGFEVIDAPGHSLGQVAFWRPSDRTLIVGDVLNNMNLMTGLPGLHEPPEAFTADPARNRESARKLAPLEPELVLFGHGAPLRDPRRFADFIAGLEG